MPPVLVADERDVRLVTLARPEARNAMDGALIEALARALLERPASTRVVVLHGAGGHFCAGADRTRGIAVGGSDATALDLLQEIARALRDPAWISIAAVEGWAVGGGLELALACDLLVCAEDSRLRLPEAGLGLHVTGGASWLLPRAVGVQRAALLMLAGETVDGATAASWGLAAASVAADGTLPRARALADALAAMPRDALGAAKRSLARALEDSFETCLHAEARETAALLSRHPGSLG